MPLSREEFRDKYPVILDWIMTTLAAHAPHARAVGTLGFRSLGQYFSAPTLAAAKVVVVDRLPIPPLSRLGLAQFSSWENGHYGGITFLDTFFVSRSEAGNESLHFHELIHIVQWRLLGPERFMADYAGGLEKFGYRASPLEIMAYDAQDRFDRSERFNAEELVAGQLLP